MSVFHHKNFHHRDQRGLSFVEMLVVLALFTIISYAVFAAIGSFYRYNSYTIAQSMEVREARVGVERMVRDLREMAYADNGAYPLISFASSSVRFYSDIDRDESVEQVTYILEGETLVRRVFNATGSPPVYTDDTADSQEVVAASVRNYLEGVDVFTYYDSAGEVVTDRPADVRFIDVQLVVNVDPARNPGELVLRSSAALRNVNE